MRASVTNENQLHTVIIHLQFTSFDVKSEKNTVSVDDTELKGVIIYTYPHVHGIILLMQLKLQRATQCSYIALRSEMFGVFLVITELSLNFVGYCPAGMNI